MNIAGQKEYYQKLAINYLVMLTTQTITNTNAPGDHAKAFGMCYVWCKSILDGHALPGTKLMEYSPTFHTIFFLLRHSHYSTHTH